jgi:signal transduction histidine kinase
VVGDPDLLRSGFENLVRNAIRHGARDSVIEIEARRSGGEILVTVSDRGPGVPPEHLERIFEPYFRVPGNDATDGTGLGLAIARRVFLQHQGSAQAANREAGGLTVTVRIPAAQMD